MGENVEMDEHPVIDGRDRSEILDHIKEIAPHYVDGWDPDREDAGTALFEIFSDMTADVIERLDRVPEKHQAAFLSALDFDIHPPQPATTPVAFTVDGAADENITIPPHTTVEAESTEDRPAQQFETTSERPFEVTPASITDVYSVDPVPDRIIEHGSFRDGPLQFFVGENQQQHELYLGHDDLLNLNPGATLELEIETNATADVFRNYLEWEFYGENDDGAEGWHEMTVRDRQERSVASLSEFQQVEGFLERQEPYLSTSDYEFVPSQPNYTTLVRSVAADVRNGNFASPDSTDRDDDQRVFPPDLLDVRSIDEPAETRLLQQLDGLKQRLQSLASGTQFAGTQGTVSLSLELPGETAETELRGTETRWIRCRIPDHELATPLFDILLRSIRVSIGSDRGAVSDGLVPDEAITNDVVLDMDSDDPVLPLGTNPTESATFNVACREAFTKPGATVEMAFDATEEGVPEDNDAEPELVWEYWNGTGWRRLDATDGTDQLRESGTVEFDVPRDIEATSVVGHDHHWIRARLVSGNYGEMKIEEREGERWERTTDHIAPPAYHDITIEYSQSDIPFNHLLRHNNHQYERVDTRQTEFQPFESLPGEKQAVYLGFDGPLRGGPIHLYLPMQGTIYPHVFSPRIDVEYCSDPEAGTWRRLNLRDGSADLTERGILQLTFPEETEQFTLFGADRHWIRIRLTGDEFTRTETGVYHLRELAVGSTGPNELSTESIVEREQNEQTRLPPVLNGLYINTDWGRNTATVENEVLGSSSGTASQTFEFANAPVLDAEIWVDELESLSQHERTRLQNDDSTPVRLEQGPDGMVTEFWVQWSSVPDFFDSEASAREYVLSRSDGVVEFGNGKQGAIPPEGDNNVIAEYQNGGGDDGNVEAGAITGLADDIESIDAVTNPSPAENGQDKETLSEFVSRAPKRLRDRGKPVTSDEVERIAASAARGIAQVECKAGETEAGAPGHVTLLVVPDTTQRQPVPSVELLGRVEETMREQAPEAVAGDQSRLTVRGPNYVEVAVEATVEIPGAQNTTLVQEQLETALTEFAHPITGGPDDDGWTIGSVPPPQEFSACLERRENIGRILGLSVTYTEGDSEVTLAAGEGAPTTSPDVLIYSGRHDVSVELAGET